MSYGLAMSLSELAERLEKENRQNDAALIRKTISEMGLTDAKPFMVPEQWKTEEGYNESKAERKAVYDEIYRKN
jgi:hypothetical protein